MLWRAVLVSVVLVAVSCGGGSGSGGDTRTVLVDYRHDEMVTSMIDFFPETVQVHPGDTVRFRQFWTGEAHNVTFGTSFNAALGRIRQRLARPPRPTAADVEDDLSVLDSLPVILGGDRGPFVVNQNGAQPCFLDKGLPPADPDRACPHRRQPLFSGRHSYYSSGFIRHVGEGANLFTVKLSDDIAPGDYNFYCTLHGVGQSGTMTVVSKGASIASQSDVSRQARDAIETDFAGPLRQALAQARTGKLDLAGKTYSTPLVGLATDGIRSWAGLAHQRHLEHRHGSVNQFVPATVHARAGDKVTWTFTGRHTISFNVPTFFPIFSVATSGRVAINPDGHQPVGFAGRPPGQTPGQPVDIDAGTWDGRGFRSSGLDWQTGDRFSLAFSRPGTYLMACLVHPSMVGKVVVEG